MSTSRTAVAVQEVLLYHCCCCTFFSSCRALSSLCTACSKGSTTTVADCRIAAHNGCGFLMVHLFYVMLVVEEVLLYMTRGHLLPVQEPLLYRFCCTAAVLVYTRLYNCCRAKRFTLEVLSRHDTECRSCTGALPSTVEEHAELLPRAHSGHSAIVLALRV